MTHPAATRCMWPKRSVRGHNRSREVPTPPLYHCWKEMFSVLTLVRLRLMCVYNYIYRESPPLSLSLSPFNPPNPPRFNHHDDGAPCCTSARCPLRRAEYATASPFCYCQKFGDLGQKQVHSRVREPGWHLLLERVKFGSRPCRALTLQCSGR